jgi:hypothetical protein
MRPLPTTALLPAGSNRGDWPTAITRIAFLHSFGQRANGHGGHDGFCVFGFRGHVLLLIDWFGYLTFSMFVLAAQRFITSLAAARTPELRSGPGASHGVRCPWYEVRGA